MINGVDLLYTICTLVLLWGILVFSTHYHNWAVWNQERRWQRKRFRTEQAERFEEDEYRTYLRRLISDDGLIAVMHRATRAFQRFNEVFQK
jgi:hypothetical protein